MQTNGEDQTAGGQLLGRATPLQAGMYFHAVAHPHSGVDVEHVTISHEGSIDHGRFFDAWRTVLDGLPELRSAVRLIDGRPWLFVRDGEPFTVQFWNIANSIDPAGEIPEVYAADRRLGFDLEAGPLMRFTVSQLPDGGTNILWSFHHILLDGRSFPLVLERVLAIYERDEQLPPPRRSMTEYADALTSLDHSAASDAWTHKLADIDGPSSILTVTQAAAEAGRGVEAIERRLGAELSGAVRQLAASTDVSVHNVIQAGWGVVLHHHSQKTPVIFGSTRAGRHVITESDDAIGLFILTVPFIMQLDGDVTADELLSTVRDEQRALRPLETTPLEQIQYASGFGATPLFESLVMYDDATLNTRMCDRLGIETPWSFDYAGQTNFALTLLAYGEADIMIRLEHDTSRFDSVVANLVLERLINVLTNMVAEPSVPVASLPYLTPADLSQLHEWNATDTDWDQSSTLVDLLEQQTQRTPDAPAVTFRDRTYTYREFDAWTNGLAASLQDRGVGRDVLVGVVAERSIELELCIHAIVKAGGGFVPLDPALPDDRLAMMANDAQLAIILSQPGHADRPCFDGIDVMSIDLADPSWDTWPRPLTHRPVARDLAYALFTSGSTGKPKCAANEHRAIVNRLRWMQQAFPLDESDVVLQKTPYSFDVSVWEHFWALCVGAHLVIAEPGAHHDPRVLANEIINSNVTTIHFVPSMLQLFVEEPAISKCTSLRRIIASGEALPRPLQDKVFDALDVELHNLYGPTEAAIDVTWWACDPESQLGHIPIGAAISNTQIHILDSQQRPVPPGVPGELYIGGVQVGRGYVNQPELTAERFVDDPFGYDDKIYATGDLARHMPDGNIEYLGRLDFQVKIRGLRIELGEIEATVGRCSGVRETIVLAREDEHGNQQLVGYAAGDGLEPLAIKSECARTLPTWMIPDQWVLLDTFPLNASGKVDRLRLPAPAAAPRRTAPLASDSQRRVGTIWAEVLEHDNFGPDDPFFDVGGSSLDLIRLAVMLGDAIGRDVPVVDLLKVVTVRAQARLFVEGRIEPDQAIERSLAQANARRGARRRTKAGRR